MYKLMSPGPTQVSDSVLHARSLPFLNPDIDLDFFDYYKETCNLISSLLHTQNETLILGGEGILGLEAACASLTEPGDRVLVIDNGIFGRGFADFVTLYGGVPEIYHADEYNALDISALAEYLKEHHNFKYATVVHCDTPSGVLNDIGSICPLLKSYGILTVVDSVSATFGEYINIDKFQIDLLCGGSQKAVSAPPGLTFVVVSDTVKAAMNNRKTPIASFYANLNTFAGYYDKKWFPYTMPVSDIYGLRAAFDKIASDDTLYQRHKTIGEATRKTLQAAGLKLHLKSGFSNTVTVFDIPQGLTAEQILEPLKSDYHILLAGSFDDLAGKVIRIGHMGSNATIENMTETLDALGKVLQSLGIQQNVSMKDDFLNNIENLHD